MYSTEHYNKYRNVNFTTEWVSVSTLYINILYFRFITNYRNVIGSSRRSNVHNLCVIQGRRIGKITSSTHGVLGPLTVQNEDLEDILMITTFNQVVMITNFASLSCTYSINAGVSYDT